MDLASVATILAAIEKVVEIAAPLVIKGVENVKPFAEIIYNLATGKDITNEQVDGYLAKANALSAQIQSPDFIPPKQNDDV